jgi:hypothetical protein
LMTTAVVMTVEEMMAEMTVAETTEIRRVD